MLTTNNEQVSISAFPLFSICAEAAGIKRISAVTRALFMSVSVGEKQIAKGDFFGSFLCQQRNEQTSPLYITLACYLFSPQRTQDLTPLLRIYDINHKQALSLKTIIKGHNT